MILKKIILRSFLPFVLVFMVLSMLSMVPFIQKTFYPVFENFSVSLLNTQITDVYFKSKPKSLQTDLDYNTIVVLFNSKKVITAIANEAKRRNLMAQYDYQGFKINIDETFLSPLIFFISLLIFTPGTLKRKLISLMAGMFLILCFSYLMVYFKGLFMVGKSGVRDFQYSQNDVNFFQAMHFFFSPVTVVSVVLITWVLVAFRKSDLKKLFDRS